MTTAHRCSRCPTMIESGIMCLPCADVEAGKQVRRMQHGFDRAIAEFHSGIIYMTSCKSGESRCTSR